MKLPKSILRGYDKVTMKYVARALGIPIPKQKGGRTTVKIPVSAIRSGSKSSGSKGKKGGGKKMGMKVGALKSKQKPNDKDGDE